MAISTSSTFFPISSPNFSFNSKPSSQSISASVRFRSSQIPTSDRFRSSQIPTSDRFRSSQISTTVPFRGSQNPTSDRFRGSQIPTSDRFRSSQISASYATAERTSPIRSFRNSTPSSLYDVLGIRIGADSREVKSAYRKLARVLHPDVVGNGNSSSADEFMKVHSAYVTLVDPEKRADYDRSLVQLRAGGLSSPVSSGGSYRSRRWETDQCW